MRNSRLPCDAKCVAFGQQILAEPVGRNTAAAIGLAAIHLAARIWRRADGRASLRQLHCGRGEISRSGARRAGIGAHAWEHGGAWAFRPRVRRPATDISSEAEFSHGRAEWRPMPCADSRKNRHCPWRGSTSPPENTFGMRGCFSGAPQLFWILCGGFFRRHMRRWLNSRKLLGRADMLQRCAEIYPRLESISVDYAVMEPATQANPAQQGNARTSASICSCFRDSCEGRLERHRLVGRGVRIAGAETWRKCFGGPIVHAGRERKLFLEPEEICSGDRSARFGAGGNGRCDASLSRETIAGRGENRKMAGEAETQALVVNCRTKGMPPILAANFRLAAVTVPSPWKMHRLYC